MDGLRPLWRSPQDMPEGPGNLPRNIRRFGAFGATDPGGPGGPPPIVDVREVNRYPFVTVLNFSLTTTSQLAVNQPDGLRILLAVRNASASANVAFVAFGRDASVATATFEIAIGGVILLDYVVPQDDVYVASAGTSTIIVTYAHVAI